MRRNCNLELRLFPLYDSDRRRIMESEEAEEAAANESPQQQHQQNHQPLTIFYDGKICVCDVTEFQARSILMLASKEVRTPTSGSSEPSSPLLKSSSSSQHNLSSPASASAAAGTSLSMKRSLQRFLQKRKNRIQEASPYHL